MNRRDRAWVQPASTLMRAAALGCAISLAGAPAFMAQPPAARLAFADVGPESAPPPRVADPIPYAPPPGADGTLPIDLPTALRLVNTSNPTVAAARARVDAAYARLREVQTLWLPDLTAGTTYIRHDGRIQNATGFVFNTNKQSLVFGGTAALTLQTSEALFGPLVARQLFQAQTASARAVNQDVQLDAALAYLDLLLVYGQLAVNAESLLKAEEMMRRAASAEERGFGKTPADANRARTEVALRRQERVDLVGRAASVSARLAQLLLLEPTVDLRPADPTVLPVTLVAPQCALDELIAAGLLNRPELAENRALQGAAIARWRAARVGPLLPRLEISYGGGDFGGGINGQMDNWGPRGDGLAQATWELHHLGFGDRYRAQALRAQVAEANFHATEIQARVAAEVTTAAKLARYRFDTLTDAQRAVQQAEEMWRRLERASFGLAGPARQFDPLEPLLAEQALHQARMQYLTEVIEYNRAQFRLFWAMGQPPLEALPGARAQPVAVPVLPPRTDSAGGPLPPPGRVNGRP